MENEVERQNVYTSLISNCKGEARDIRDKIMFITKESTDVKDIATPTRNELESELVELLQMLKALKNSIVR